MLSSAIRSRSIVVIPGRIERRSSSRVSPTTRPAARMTSICVRVLSSTPRSRNTRRPGSALLDGGEGVQDALGDLVDVTGPVDLAEQPTAPVDLDQRLGLLEVQLLAAADHVLGVVGATLGLRPGGQSPDQLVGVDGDADDGVEAVAG